MTVNGFVTLMNVSCFEQYSKVVFGCFYFVFGRLRQILLDFLGISFLFQVFVQFCMEMSTVKEGTSLEIMALRPVYK